MPRHASLSSAVNGNTSLSGRVRPREDDDVESLRKRTQNVEISENDYVLVPFQNRFVHRDNLAEAMKDESFAFDDDVYGSDDEEQDTSSDSSANSSDKAFIDDDDIVENDDDDDYDYEVFDCINESRDLPPRNARRAEGFYFEQEEDFDRAIDDYILNPAEEDDEIYENDRQIALRSLRENDCDPPYMIVPPHGVCRNLPHLVGETVEMTGGEEHSVYIGLPACYVCLDWFKKKDIHKEREEKFHCENGHYCHTWCIEEWAKTSPTCPGCKSLLVTQEVHQIWLAHAQNVIHKMKGHEHNQNVVKCLVCDHERKDHMVVSKDECLLCLEESLQVD